MNNTSKPHHHNIFIVTIVFGIAITIIHVLFHILRSHFLENKGHKGCKCGHNHHGHKHHDHDKLDTPNASIVPTQSTDTHR